MAPSVLAIALSVDGKECVSRSSGSYLVWSALKKVGDREDGEATSGCPFKPVEKGFVHVAHCNSFFFFYVLLILRVQSSQTCRAPLKLENISTKNLKILLMSHGLNGKGHWTVSCLHGTLWRLGAIQRHKIDESLAGFWVMKNNYV